MIALSSIFLLFAGCTQSVTSDSTSTNQVSSSPEPTTSVIEFSSEWTESKDTTSADLVEETTAPQNTESPSNTVVRLDVPSFVQENNYYCVPACVQMVLAYHGITASQSELAAAMNTVPETGTEYADLARVINAYLFGNPYPSVGESGYRVQAVSIGDRSSETWSLFEQRIRADIENNDPVFAAIDNHVVYEYFSKANHMILMTGFEENSAGQIVSYYFLDPYYLVQDEVYGGLKVIDADTLYTAVAGNEEPAYIW